MVDPRLRVLLADDHPLMLEALRQLLAPECEVVGAVTEASLLLEAAELLRPDMAVVDISMPGMDGIEATRLLRAIAPATRVLILSFHVEPSWARATFEAGAWGYVCKGSATEEIGLALREFSQGRYYVSPMVARGLMTSAVPGAAQSPAARSLATILVPAGEELTRREQDIVRLVGRGLGNKDIAYRLGVSVTTVRTHLSNVYGKLGSTSRVELALLAAQGGAAVM